MDLALDLLEDPALSLSDYSRMKLELGVWTSLGQRNHNTGHRKTCWRFRVEDSNEVGMKRSAGGACHLMLQDDRS